MSASAFGALHIPLEAMVCSWACALHGDASHPRSSPHRFRCTGSEAHLLIVPTRYVRNAASLCAADAPLLEQMLAAAAEVMRDAIGSRFDEAELLMGFHWPPHITVNWLHLHVMYPKVRAAPQPPLPSPSACKVW